MKLQIKKCKTCGRVGLGPNAVKLWPFEGRLYCAEHYKEALNWNESRGNVVLALQFEVAVPAKQRKWKEPHWRTYITDLCDMAEFALLHDDKRTFVYYAARALYAWTLKEIA